MRPLCIWAMQYALEKEGEGEEGEEGGELLKAIKEI